MNSPRPLPALLGLLAIFQTAPLLAQEKLSDRILADHPTLIINSLDVVQDDLLRLGQDLAPNFGIEHLVREWFNSDGSGIDRNSGVILYELQNFHNSVLEYRASDPKMADSHFKEETKPEDAASSWRSFRKNRFPFADLMTVFGLSREQVGLRIDDRFFVRSQDSKKTKKEDFDWLLADKSKLATKMDPVSHQIIDKSGMSYVLDKSTLDLLSYFDAKDIVDASNFQSLTGSERIWLEDLAKLSKDTEYALTGLKYHDRVMELRSHIKLAKETQLDDLFNIKESQKPWDAVLGFEHQGLAGVVALNMKAFKSAAAARAIPKIGLSEVNHSEATRFLNGNMLQLLSELIGDSWNDFSATRLGVYENDAEQKAGQVAIVGVVDAKDPQQLIAELKKISALSMPTDKNAEAEAQRQRVINELIEDLKSDTDRVASRAETRLKLGGEVALKSIRDAMPNLNPNAKVRAKRVDAGITRILKSRNKKKAVIDPKFWTTLNPKLEFKNAEKTADGFNAFLIEISPDPSKPEEVRQQARGMMKGLFGDQWNTIPVIQVEDHFVFMIGSNQEKLNQICRNVRDQKNDLLKHLNGVGDGSQSGQFQVMFNPEKLDRIFGISRQANWIFHPKKKPEDDEKLCWVGLNLNSNSLGAEFLLPIDQFQSFFNALH